MTEFRSITRAPLASVNELSKTFWAAVKQDPNGTWFAPGFIGPTYFNDNPNSYIELATSAYDPNNQNQAQPQSYTFSITTAPFAKSPGLAKVMVTKQYARDINKPVTGNGATLVPRGALIAQVNIEILIWTAQQWGAFQSFIAQYLPTPKVEPKPYPAHHPDLIAVGIKIIQIWGIDGPKPGPYPRSKIWTLSCTDWYNATEQAEIPPAPDDYVFSPYASQSLTNNLALEPPGTTEAPDPGPGLNQD